SKVVGVGNAHKTLCYRKFLIAKRQAVWRLEHNGASLLIATAIKRKATLLKRNLLTLCHSLVLTFVFY
ncbi:hypothetical protein, partial [Ruminococcus sp.]